MHVTNILERCFESRIISEIGRQQRKAGIKEVWMNTEIIR